MKRSILILSIFLLLGSVLYSQNRKVLLSAGGGIMYYLGDLSESALPKGKQMNPHFQVSTTYRFSPTFHSSFSILYGRVSGADSLTSKKESRDYHFKSSILDFGLSFGMNTQTVVRKLFRDKGIKKRFDHTPFIDGPKLVAGVGFFRFNPRAKHDGVWRSLQKLGTEGQRLDGDYPKPYRRWQMNVKFGGEIGFKLNRRTQIDLYGYYTMLFTDYLDDISGTFPNYQELLDGPNGELTAEYTYRLKDGSIPSERSKRGNSAFNDSFLFFGLKLTYGLSRAQLDLIRHK